MASSPSPLTHLQARVLEAFKGLDSAWLTGGSLLGGFYLGHRGSLDLDVFTQRRDMLPELSARLEAWCEEAGAQWQITRDYPGFRRYQVRLEGASTLVDLVHDQSHQVVPVADKPVREGLRVDPLREIRANKLAALLGRGETKDLVDLYALARAGWPPLEGLEDASTKDGGVEPATMAWVLTQVSIDLEGLLLTSEVDPAELRKFRDELVEQLQRLAFPA